jgi:hypothetical protein
MAGQDLGTGPIWERPYRPAWMRLLNASGRALRRVGRRWPPLEPGEFLAAAEGKTRLSDWGDDRFREGLKALVEAFDRQDAAHALGRIAFRLFCLRLLTNRLRIVDELKRHPETLDVPIRRPLIVTGLPRSGTTFLHHLLAQYPSGRPLLLWETFEPVPSPRPETYRTDPRIKRTRKVVRALTTLAPRITAAHDFDAENPEECNNLFAHEFEAGFLGFMFDAPEYIAWLRGRDQTATYRSVRRQLQILSRYVPGDPWVLKAPSHIFHLDALLAVFPDASVVMLHRDPLQVLPSLCSLAAALRSIYSDDVDPCRLGKELTEALALGLDRALTVRASADPARFFDVSYPALVANPAGTVEAICEYFNYKYDNIFDNRVHGWLAGHPQHKNGVHRYSLDQFGLEPESLEHRFAAYRRWREENLQDVPLRL